MGTSMAVNYANLFMARFEEEMLRDYETKHGKRPLIWLRYIDDVFFIWVGSEESLQHFLEFVKHYSKNTNMKSNIQFKDIYSTRAVTFLDTIISIEGNKLTTNLYSKPTAAYDYLQRSSYHPQHLLKAIPKGQFMRIRRICTHLQHYKQHANKFIEHFRKRGYNENLLHKTAEEVADMSRDDLLTYRNRTVSDRTPLVITYHHKLSNIPTIIRKNFEKMIQKHPDMKTVFPSPPVVSFRRPRNLRDSLVCADHTKRRNASSCCAAQNPPRTKTTIEKLMNNGRSITNKRIQHHTTHQGWTSKPTEHHICSPLHEV